MKNKGQRSYVRKATSLTHLLSRAPTSLLHHLTVELTERCNNNCIHCYINRPADDSDALERELDTATIKELLEEAAALGCLSVRLTGGEPLLRDDFEAIYLKARKLGMKVTIGTNATQVTPRIAHLLSRVPPLGTVEVSVYGMTEAVYDRVSRTPGAFEAAWRGIKRLLDEGIAFQPRCYLPLDDEAGRKELTGWVASLPHPAEVPPTCWPLYLRGRRDSEQKNATIRKLRPSPSQCVDGFMSHSMCFESESRELISRHRGVASPRLFICGAGKGSACLDPYGNAQPCLLLRHPATARAVVSGDNSLKTVMQESFPALRTIEAGNPQYLQRCARCFLRGFCEQCPAQSWMEHGTLDTPVEYFCDVAHEAAMRLGLLNPGEKAWKVEGGRNRIPALAEKKDAYGTHPRISTATAET